MTKIKKEFNYVVYNQAIIKMKYAGLLKSHKEVMGYDKRL